MIGIYKNSIVKIFVHLKKQSSHYYYHKKNTWFDKASGIYLLQYFGKDTYIGDENQLKLQNSHLFLENNIIYHKPYIIVFLNDESSYEVYFDDPREIDTFLEQNKLNDMILLNYEL